MYSEYITFLKSARVYIGSVNVRFNIRLIENLILDCEHDIQLHWHKIEFKIISIAFRKNVHY